MIEALGGNDRICALDGVDRPAGGPATAGSTVARDGLLAGDLQSMGDTIGDGGNDLLLGGDGDDAIVGDNNSLFGNAGGRGGNDILRGGEGSNQPIGDHRSGPGVVSGRGGNNFLDGAPDWTGLPVTVLPRSM